MAEGDKNTLSQKFLLYSNNAGIVLILTGLSYYFVTISTEIYYDSVGFPKGYIDYHFYGLTKALEPIFIYIIPIVLFIIAVVKIALEHSQLKDRTDVKSKMTQYSYKWLRYEYWLNIIAIFLILILCCFSFLADINVLKYYKWMFLLVAVMMIVKTLYMYLRFFGCQFEPSNYSVLASERVGFVLVRAYFSLVMYSVVIFITIFISNFYSQETLTIDRRSINCNEQTHFCDMKYQVVDKGEYSLWSTVSFQMPKTKDKEEDPIYFYLQNNTMTRSENKDLEITLVSLDRHFESATRPEDQRVESKTDLYFKDWEELKRLLFRKQTGGLFMSSFTFKGKTYQVTEDATLNHNSNYGDHFMGVVVDKEGNYHVARWEILNDVNSIENLDELECDWENPVAVEKL